MLFFIIMVMCCAISSYKTSAHYFDSYDQLPDVYYSQLPETFLDYVGNDIETFKLLLEGLLDSYDARIRPILNQSSSIKVSSQFHPMSLIEFDTAQQKFSILGYFEVYWTDELITWDPAIYGDTNVVKFPVYQVWSPSLIVLKAFDGNGVIGNSNIDIVRVSSDGKVVWVPDGIYSVICHVDIKYYPFDEQNCVLTYYVADETIKSVRLDHDHDVNLDEFTANTAWDVYGVSKRSYLQYGTYYIDVSFHLRRRANFTTFTLIMPLLMLAFLNICVFLVPIGSGEKGSFAITIFLSYGIFVTIVSDTLPHNSLQVSLFVLFITILLFLSAMSVFYTIVQAKIMASLGEKECSWQCLRPKTRNPNQIKPLDRNDPEMGNVDDRSTEQDVYTWRIFLEKVDTIIFGVFMLSILITTATFFCLLLQKGGEDNFTSG